MMEKTVSREDKSVSDDESGRDRDVDVYDYDGILSDEWSDEVVVEEYFSKRKSRVRKQNKRFSKNYNKYDDEW